MKTPSKLVKVCCQRSDLQDNVELRGLPSQLVAETPNSDTSIPDSALSGRENRRDSLMSHCMDGKVVWEAGDRTATAYKASEDVLLYAAWKYLRVRKTLPDSTLSRRASHRIEGGHKEPQAMRKWDSQSITATCRSPLGELTWNGAFVDTFLTYLMVSKSQR